MPWRDVHWWCLLSSQATPGGSDVSRWFWGGKTHGFTSKNHPKWITCLQGEGYHWTWPKNKGILLRFHGKPKIRVSMPCHEVGNPSSDPPSVQSGSRQRERPKNGQSGVTCYEKSLAKREIYPLANPEKPRQAEIFSKWPYPTRGTLRSCGSFPTGFCGS